MLQRKNDVSDLTYGELLLACFAISYFIAVKTAIFWYRFIVMK